MDQVAAAPVAEAAVAPAAEVASAPAPDQQQQGVEAESPEVAQGEKTEQSAENTGDIYAGLKVDGEVNDELFVSFKDIAQKYEISPEAAQEILNLQDKMMPSEEEIAAFRQQAVTEQAETWLGQLKALPDLGGKNFEASKAQASKVMQLASPELRQYLNETGLGNHPEIFKFIHTISTKMSEASMINTGHVPAGGGQRKANHEVFYPPSN